MTTIALIKKATPAPKPRLLPNEELFGDGPCSIECRACGAEEHVYPDHPALLCASCLVDLGATARRIAEAYASAMVAFFDASAKLSARSSGNAWYAKTEQARGDMSISPATFQRAWEAARLEGGDKAVLIGLRDAMDLAAEQMRAAEVQYISAAPELAAARIAFGEPVGA